MHSVVLAQNGLYCASNSGDQSTDILFDHLGRQAASLFPHMIHVKCAFCSFETFAVLKNRLENHISHESPIEQHRSHSEQKDPCKIFADTNNPQKQLKLIRENELKRKVPWVEQLFCISEACDDDENRDDSFYLQNAIKRLNDELSFDDVTLNKLPKVIVALMAEASRKSDDAQEATTSVHYAPGTASSFEQLKDILLKSTKDVMITEKPKHPNYCTLDSRLKSFENWPTTLAQRPNELARAGFYYYGLKDWVKRDSIALFFYILYIFLFD